MRNSTVSFVRCPGRTVSTVLVAVLAAVVMACPIVPAGVLVAQEDVETPIEETSTTAAEEAICDCRKESGRGSRTRLRIVARSSRVGSLSLRPAARGHRLPNGLSAPIRA